MIEILVNEFEYKKLKDFSKITVRIAINILAAYLCMLIVVDSETLNSLRITAFVIDMYCIVIYVLFIGQISPYTEEQIRSKYRRKWANEAITDSKRAITRNIAACSFVTVAALLFGFFVWLGDVSTIKAMTVLTFITWFAFVTSIFCILYTVINTIDMAKEISTFNEKLIAEKAYAAQFLEPELESEHIE